MWKIINICLCVCVLYQTKYYDGMMLREVWLYLILSHCCLQLPSSPVVVEHYTFISSPNPILVCAWAMENEREVKGQIQRAAGF